MEDPEVFQRVSGVFERLPGGTRRSQGCLWGFLAVSEDIRKLQNTVKAVKY